MCHLLLCALFIIVFSVCQTERPFWEFDSCLSVCLSVRTPYILELILASSVYRYIRSLQIMFMGRNRPYILKHTISPGNIYRTNVPYHIPYHIIFAPHRAIIPYHRQKYLPHKRTISHTMPYIFSTSPCDHIVPPTYHITYSQCHTTHNAIPYPDNIILSIPYPPKKYLHQLDNKKFTLTPKLKLMTTKHKKNVQKSKKERISGLDSDMKYSLNSSR